MLLRNTASPIAQITETTTRTEILFRTEGDFPSTLTVWSFFWPTEILGAIGGKSRPTDALCSRRVTCWAQKSPGNGLVPGSLCVLSLSIWNH